MFGPSPFSAPERSTMTSADSCQFSRTFIVTGYQITWHTWQASPGKSVDFPSIHPPHILSAAFGTRTSLCFASSSNSASLLCGSCSSGRRFAAGFLQTPPHGGRPCLKLTTTATFVARDLHPIANAHAGRTQKRLSVTSPKALMLLKKWCRRADFTLSAHR